MSEQDNKGPVFSAQNFVADGLVEGDSSPPDVPRAFSFPALHSSVNTIGKNPLLRSLKDFLPAVFEQALPVNSEKNPRNIEDTRRRLLDQLETFKRAGK